MRENIDYLAQAFEPKQRIAPVVARKKKLVFPPKRYKTPNHYGKIPQNPKRRIIEHNKEHKEQNKEHKEQNKEHKGQNKEQNNENKKQFKIPKKTSSKETSKENL